MNKLTRLTLEKVADNMPAIFEAARTLGPQEIEDGDGVFTLSYSRSAAKRDAREFLANGARDRTDGID
ncbi:hypothetical protein HRR99_07290 [Agrobacterium vaccinii]|uniref:hypothetical protein n=1 Tax=Agrobacterium vaccinii TaxID=2735528 RepID=UPI001E31E098|nr:hypothetical protein [Agrobacterium vaccinii]UHS61329.1 hypothetical protein HRR99_07290 [Agrobacterium vaccinii]